MLRDSTVRASSQLQHRLRSAELRAGVACNQRLQDSQGYSTVPLTSSIDLCTPQQQTTPLHFRAGVYHVSMIAYLNVHMRASLEHARTHTHTHTHTYTQPHTHTHTQRQTHTRM